MTTATRRSEARDGATLKFRMKGGPSTPRQRHARSHATRGYASVHAGRSQGHRVHERAILKTYRQDSHRDMRELLGDPVQVMMHATQTPPWVRRRKNRAKNKLQRASRRANRR